MAFSAPGPQARRGLRVSPARPACPEPTARPAHKASAARAATLVRKVNPARPAALAPPDRKEIPVQQDSQGSVEGLGQQALKVQQATLDLWAQWVRLGLAAQMAWLDL